MAEVGKIRRLASVMACLGLALGVSQPAVADSQNGQRLYWEYCAGCHGNDAAGIGGQGPDLTRVELFDRPDGDLMRVIRSGQNMMPPYVGILTDVQIADVINYLRTIQR